MTNERNFKKELLYSSYIDMEEGRDMESIDYECLIGIITELHNRIEKLEKWKSRVQKVGKEVSAKMKDVDNTEIITQIEELTTKMNDANERNDELLDKIQDYRDVLKG